MVGRDGGQEMEECAVEKKTNLVSPVSGNFTVDDEGVVGRVLETLQPAPCHVLHNRLRSPVIEKGIEVPAVYVYFDALL